MKDAQKQTEVVLAEEGKDNTLDGEEDLGAEEGIQDLDETADIDPLTDGELQTDDEIDDAEEDDVDLVIVNPDVDETWTRRMSAGSASLRSAINSRRGSKAGGRPASQIGSHTGSQTGSKHGSKAVSKAASPVATINRYSPSPFQLGSRCNSLAVLQEEEDEHQVSFAPNRPSRRPSTLAVPGSGTPHHGILKTPIRSTPVTPTFQDPDGFLSPGSIDIGQELGNTAYYVESGIQNNLPTLNEIGGTPLQRLRSRANSLLQSVVGSKLVSRAQSKAVSRIGSPKNTGMEESLSVDKTLELAADALAEQADTKADSKVAENVGKQDIKADETKDPAALAGGADPNMTGI